MLSEKKRGQSLVEFALTLPVLLMIILGIIEVALVIQGHLAVQHAAREAARFAITYRPVAGQKLDGSLCDATTPQGPPFADPARICNRNEPNDANLVEYHARRVALIKQIARERAAGLRINSNYIGDTPTKFNAYKNQPGFFGVLVWGYPSFETNCNDPVLANKVWNPSNPPVGCFDFSGIEGLPVRVYVRHNVEILDPFYRLIARYVTVQAEAEMVNEGYQVGLSGQPIPSFIFNPNPDVGTPVPPTVTPPGGILPTPTPFPTVPPSYDISLTSAPEGQDLVINLIPESRCHDFVATVTYQGQPVQYAWVSLYTDGGAFSYSGVSRSYVEILTNAQGQATATLCGNRPMTATLRAWIDVGNDDTWNGENSDTAQKAWQVGSGPYILVSDHEVTSLDTDFADVMNHEPGQYDLYWCVISGTNTSTLLGSVTVDASRNALDQEFTIPDGSEGLYHLETHPSGGGGCGAPDLVAYSADIKAIIALPDLSVVSLNLPQTICPRTVFTVSAVVQNLTRGRTDQTFDVDFYTGTVGSPPQSPIGLDKQWVSGIEREASVTLNTLMWVASPGTHTIWARADTSDYVEESDEGNNASSVSFTAGYTTPMTMDTGWRNPTANYAVANGGFTNPQGAYADDDGSYATRDNSADGVTHAYRDYGFSIPVSATILGIEVGVDWWLDSTYGTNRIYVSLSWNGGANWTSTRTANTERTNDGSGLTDTEGGSSDTWGRTWNPSEFSDANFRVRLELDTNNAYRDFRIDWVPVRVTYQMPATCPANNDPPPWGQDTGKPPGLLECSELLRVRGFEGNPDTVFAYWQAGGPGAFRRQSVYYYEGTMSMRLHTTLGSYPGCTAISNPYLYQTVQIPTEVYTQTTMVVRGQRLVAESESPCCYPVTDPNDVLYVKMRSGSGADLAPGNGAQIVNGGVVTGTWAPFAVDVTDVVSPYARAGQNVQVYWHGIQNEDTNCTFFYLDSLSCEACTYWPIPADEPGSASFGGLVQVLVQGVPQTRQGVNVWAYSPGGQVYRTYTIQDGTYHFYNVPPGTYTIYAEFWEGSILHYGTWTVVVAPDERNYRVNLYLS